MEPRATRPPIRIVDLAAERPDLIQQAAEVLLAAFHAPSAWHTLKEALEEVGEMTAAGHIARAALSGDDVAGWIGGMPQYHGRVWELHPLAVKPAFQRQGIGRRLVQDFETIVAARGGLTILLGTDDEEAMTSLAGADLYVDLWQHIRHIRNLNGHPYEFYQKLGYTIVGVVPDADGRGKPDILMAKRVPGPAARVPGEPGGEV